MRIARLIAERDGAADITCLITWRIARCRRTSAIS